MTEEKRGPGRPPKQKQDEVALDESGTAPVVQEEPKIAARVVRGFYPEEDKKVLKGEIIDVTPMELIDGLEAGTLERVK